MDNTTMDNTTMDNAYTGENNTAGVNNMTIVNNITGISNTAAVADDAVDFEWISRATDIGIWIELYPTPFIALFGIVGNTLALIVMTKGRNRTLATCNYISALAIVDNFQMINMVYYWLYSYVTRSTVTIAVCQAVIFLANLWQECSIYLIIAMSVDRTLAVKFPLKKSIWCTVERARKVIALVIVLAILRNIHFIWYAYPATIDAERNFALCSGYESPVDAPGRVLSWIDTLVQSIIPTVTLLILNTLLIGSIRARSKVSTQMTTDQKKRKHSRDLTVMLIIVSFSVLIFTLPINVAVVIYGIIGIDLTNIGTFLIVHAITDRLYFMNNAVNFYLYCMGMARFREQVLSLIRKLTRNSVTPAAEGSGLEGPATRQTGLIDPSSNAQLATGEMAE
ncbi:unnamed protein product [Owenia fusiformis]|uniref:Uncharacterized protein n=1 Tax=Owenia fusiformis TaxID=6347 RepID=A0A8J1TGK0_OWEFU|nr:unnamed protein product [Owenia fusiformis]